MLQVTSFGGDTKYFASNAGLADYALVTARPKGAPNGAKGLGLFLVPRLDSSGRRNFTIRRLKEKSATRSVPTGEVEFHDSEASTVGSIDDGIYVTMENQLQRFVDEIVVSTVRVGKPAVCILGAQVSRSEL